MVAKLGRQLGQPFDVAAAGTGEDRDQFVQQRVIDLQRELLQHHLPYPAPRFAIGRVIADHGDAAGDDGLVDVVHPIGGEKQQAVEIFQHAQEHADHGVHGDVVVAALDVDIRFVDQHHRAPALRPGQHVLERDLHRRHAQPQLPGMHAVQGTLDDFRIHLGGQRLAHPGRPCAQHRGAAGLASHNVVHQHIHLGSQDVDEIGLLLRQNQLLFQCRLIFVGRDVVYVHPQVVVQIEVEHEEVGVHRQLREQALGHRGLGFADCRFRVVLIALRRLAQIRAEYVSGRFQRGGARAQDALVVH